MKKSDLQSGMVVKIEGSDKKWTVLMGTEAGHIMRYSPPLGSYPYKFIPLRDYNEDLTACSFTLMGEKMSFGDIVEVYSMYGNRLWKKEEVVEHTIEELVEKIGYEFKIVKKKETSKHTPDIHGAANNFRVGDIVELINPIYDGYTDMGDYNVIFPPPTLVKIVEVLKDVSDKNVVRFKYGVKVLREAELPKNLKGTQFRTKMADHAKKGKITFIGNKHSFFDGDSGIADKYFEKIYYQSESCLRAVANDAVKKQL